MFSAFVVGRILHCTALHWSSMQHTRDQSLTILPLQFNLGKNTPISPYIQFNLISVTMQSLSIFVKSLRCILGLTVDTYHLLANFIFLWRIAIESSRQANGPIHPQVEDDIRTSVRILKLFWSVKLVRVVATKTRLWLNCAIVLGFQLLFSQSIRPGEGGGSCQG